MAKGIPTISSGGGGHPKPSGGGGAADVEDERERLAREAIEAHDRSRSGQPNRASLTAAWGGGFMGLPKAPDAKPKTPSGGWRKSMSSSSGGGGSPAPVVHVPPVAPKLPETTFAYIGGWMGAGNDVHSGTMTLDAARAWALEHPECAGFTCNDARARADVEATSSSTSMAIHFKSSDVHQVGPGWHSWLVERPSPEAIAQALSLIHI